MRCNLYPFALPRDRDASMYEHLACMAILTTLGCPTSRRGPLYTLYCTNYHMFLFQLPVTAYNTSTAAS